MRKIIKITFGMIMMLMFFAISSSAQNCSDTDHQCKVDATTKKIAADPGNIENYYDRARAYSDMKNCDMAVVDYTKYIQMKPSKPEYLADGYTARGNCYRSLGKYEMSLADENLAIKTGGEKPIYYNNRGLSYHALNKHQLAIADFDHAITLDPKYAEAFYNRSRIFYDDKSYTKAISDLDKYIGMNSTNIPWLADGYDNRGLAYQQMGNSAQALKDFSKGIELDPNNALRFTHRAALYRKQGKIALAVADEKTAESLSN